MIVSSHSDANAAMNELFYSARSALDPQLEEMLATAKNSPIPPESQSTFVEAVYANREKFNEEEIGYAAAVAEFAGANGFWTMRDGRGAAIARVLRGEQTDDLPEVEQRFKVQEPPVLPEGEEPGMIP